MLPILETNRCILRSVCIDDACDMYEYASKENVVRYLTFPIHTSVGNTKDTIDGFFLTGYKNGSYDFGIVYKENNKFIGTSGFCKIEDGVAVLGYVLNSDYWNKGIMTEVIDEIMRFGFEELKLNKVIAEYYDGNTRSGRVMTRSGMNYVGSEEKEVRLQGKMVWGKIHRYELTRENYFEKVSYIINE